MHTDFSRDRSGSLVFPSLSEFSTVYLIHTVKGFGIVNKAEIDVCLELSCFFDDPVDVGNLISSSSAFSKTILNIRKFTVHILRNTGLENFEHYLHVRWVQLCGSLSILWHCLSLGLEWKLSSGHRTGKGQFSFQSQRKAMPKNAQTTAQLHSSHMLVK